MLEGETAFVTIIKLAKYIVSEVMVMYNNGVQFVKIFETVPEINEFCVAKNCIPISITPIVVRNEYKALGATSKATVIIPKYNYAVILKPIECGRD